MIVLLLLSSKSWCQNNNESLPLRANGHKDSLTTVTIPINYIKQANIKLIERKYLIELNAEKDSIIDYYKLYTNGQKVIINELTDEYVNSLYVNESIKRDLEIQEHRTKLFINTTIGASVIILLTLLIK